MARLKKPPRTSDEAPPLTDASCGVDSAHSVSDAETAWAQLNMESHSPDVLPPPSPPPPRSSRPPPSPAAILGTSLLNSARPDHRHTGPISGGMPRRNRVGKLKRASLIAESSKTNLAVRGDVYNIELSPVKGNYALPEKVNQKPLKIVKKKKQAARRLYANVSPDPPAHDAHGLGSPEIAIRSSPLENDTIAVMNTKEHETTPPGKRHAASVQDDQPAKLPRRQRQKTDEPTATNETKARARHSPQVRIVRKPSSIQEQNSDTVEGRERGTSQKRKKDASVSSRQRLPPRAHRENAQPETSQQDQAAAEDLPTDQESEYQPESDKEEGDSQNEETAHLVELPRNIEMVFKFLDLEEREGACVTTSANAIIRQCDRARAKLQGETILMDAVVKHVTKIQKMLKHLSNKVPEDDQPTFKSDAYQYVFRSLVLYLRGLYNWLSKTYESVTQSLEALRVVNPLIRAILIFKDTIAPWRVTIPQRHKGDRPIKDVDIRLIAPLREVDKAFSVRLSQLETGRRHNEYEETTRRMKEQDDARTEAIEATQERKKRWQDLHIVRMQCEPDINRRRKLFYTEFEDLVERDANGVVFERLPIFKPRSNPPHGRLSDMADETEWTEEEETAVLEGLQQYAGPHVFEKIFRTYCDPRSKHPRAGDLRNHSVAEIVSEARWIRSTMLVLYQENGWPVEEWVTKIPLLP